MLGQLPLWCHGKDAANTGDCCNNEGGAVVMWKQWNG